jgi:hypothetical protein
MRQAIKILFLLSVINAQEQFGSDIDGEAADSNYGKKLRKK